ncbi:MAG: hypothetical protein AcusKO_03150 [Acuticoccus sp.]
MAAPVESQFDQAIAVAAVGLVVNILCAVILGGGHSHGSGDHHHHHSPSQDHNLRAAYLHVVVDALTSVLAIVALVAGKFAGATWLDPAMGVVDAVLITRWSWGLLKDSGKTLLDFEAPDAMRAALRDALERNGDRVADLHVWSIGPGIHAASVSLVSDALETAKAYHEQVPWRLSVRHLTVEVRRCKSVKDQRVVLTLWKRENRSLLRRVTYHWTPGNRTFDIGHACSSGRFVRVGRIHGREQPFAYQANGCDDGLSCSARPRCNRRATARSP